MDVLDSDTFDLRYHRARYYDTATGRWLSRDPFGYVDGRNLYQYAGSNPTGRSDPGGTYWRRTDHVHKTYLHGYTETFYVFDGFQPKTISGKCYLVIYERAYIKTVRVYDIEILYRQDTMGNEAAFGMITFGGSLALIGTSCSAMGIGAPVCVPLGIVGGGIALLGGVFAYVNPTGDQDEEWRTFPNQVEIDRAPTSIDRVWRVEHKIADVPCDQINPPILLMRLRNPVGDWSPNSRERVDVNDIIPPWLLNPPPAGSRNARQYIGVPQAPY